MNADANEFDAVSAAAFAEAQLRIQSALENGIEELDLSDLGLTDIPDSIALLTHVKRLHLSNNKLRIWPESLSQLTQLELLDIANNNIIVLPNSARNCVALKSLFIHGNDALDLPHKLLHQHPLDVGSSGNPNDIFDFYFENKSLKLAIADAEARIQSALKSGAIKLNLSNLSLTALPESLQRLTGLRGLNISGNQIKLLPDSLAKMLNLTLLNVSGNVLTGLPAFVGQMSHLRALELSDNQLIALPEIFRKLKHIEKLDVRRNRLQHLPVSLRNHGSLIELHLHGNAALRLPPEVLGVEPGQHGPLSEAHRILDYYFRLRVGSRPLNEAKVILVGPGGAGKTSIVNRLLFDRFDTNERSTDGICICDWNVQLKQMEEVRLRVWDFGGQELMHATHQFFLTQRSLYVLVLEGRQDMADAHSEYWLKLIGSFGAESNGEVSPVLVVLNKIRCNAFDLNRRALKQKYPFIRGFVFTDCADATGLSELRCAIETQIDQLKYLRVSFPASWFSVKDYLTKMQRHFITYSEYRKLCRRNGESEHHGQDSLSSHLHNLGIALNYRDDPRLRDTHVLNPRWVTQGIYKILLSPQVAAQKGELCLSQVADILDPQDYPSAMYQFLFDIMKKFQLCFCFSDDDTHYLIPELLDVQEPEAVAQFSSFQCLNFKYRYPVMPEGLFPRFIVRTHSLSTNQLRWRTGVVLAFEENRALVKADVQDKSIFISVDGPAEGRRRLLAIIRSEFEMLHSDISKLRPEALVPVPGEPNVMVSYSKLLALEKMDIFRFHEEIDGELRELGVKWLLNGVDSECERGQFLHSDRVAVKIFYSYSHKDESLRNELETHLKLLRRIGMVSDWHDRKIKAGDDWNGEISEHLERAEIILLLISASFIASDYCYNVEMNRALERHAAGEARVIPIIVKDVDWKLSPFAKLKALPKEGKAVALWSKRDSAWRQVSQGIQEVVSELMNRSHRSAGGESQQTMGIDGAF